jgi:hypothetical protein
MSNVRREILNKIQKKAMADKKASDIVDDINNAEAVNSDEFAHKIFTELVNSLDVEISGLDDVGND